jgi:sodium transport system permease protein
MIVARKEATDTLRDRRTWVAMILVPILLVPILLLVAPTAAMTQMESVAQSVAHVAVVGGDGAQGFLDFLSQRPGLVLQESADPEADLAARKVQAVLYLPFGFDAAIAAERPVSLEITYDAADQRSSMAHDRLWMAINSFSAAVAEQRLLSRGVDPALLRPVSGSSRNVAPPAKMGGVFLSMIMPMLLGIWAALGGMYAAIDSTAGEKERGTLELLLSAPASRLSMVVGKFLVVTAGSLISAGIAVGGMLIAFFIKPEALLGPMVDRSGITLALPVESLALIALVSLGVAAIFAALQLAISLYARSFREAQTYLSPLSFIIILPAILTQFMPAVDVSGRVFFVPVLNVLFVYKELLEGVVNWSHIGTTLLVCLVFAFVCLQLTVSLFRKEQVLFRV